MSSLTRNTLGLHAAVRTTRLLFVLLAAGLVGCQSLDHAPASDVQQPSARALALQQEAQLLSESTEPAPAQDIWERVRDGFTLQDEIGNNPRIEHQRLWFASNPTFIQKSSKRSSPYIHYIVERLDERNMPMELALLPMIESAYNPLAYSRSHAVGLWQFIPSTGRYFNLRQTSWYDGRRDIAASTNAALTYLSRLHRMFDGDWLLALAAYNAGEGTVGRAIERNRKRGLPTDYWNLPLPKETRDYVPRLLALSQMVMAPKAYALTLSPVANEPYFEKVAIKRRMYLSRIAAMAELDEDELYLLNPAFKKRITLDGPQQLLIPTANAELLTANLLLMKPQDRLHWQEYRVRAGNSLSGIANRYKLTVRNLVEANQLPNHKLRIGQLLSIPIPAGQAPFVISQNEAPHTYKVKAGDNLWQIAKTHQLELKDLQRWNSRRGDALKPGQVLTLRLPD